ncbi:3-hydroxyisobutyrate dehydrogenase [Alphaproteobacteria bacterium LSUCC0226]
MKIGFIGLGNMGAPMARNLVHAGHDVTGFDLNPDLCHAVADQLAIADDAASAARGRDIVVTMLPNGAALLDVAKKIIPEMQESACFIDCSTVDIDTARKVATIIEAAGLYGLDAPVSGGVGGAGAGTLTFMVGGTPQALAMASPLFDIMGQRTIHCGDAGAGQAVKICNNMILGATMIVTCEAFALADNLGLDRQKLFDVVSTSSGSSWSVNSYCPVPGVGPKSPADNDYKPGFSTAMMVKDLALAADAATMTGTNTTLGKAALALYQNFAGQGNAANADFSAILKAIKQSQKD